MAKKTEPMILMPKKPKALLSKISKEQIRSTFQNCRLEIKLLQELG